MMGFGFRYKRLLCSTKARGRFFLAVSFCVRDCRFGGTLWQSVRRDNILWWLTEAAIGSHTR